MSYETEVAALTVAVNTVSSLVNTLDTTTKSAYNVAVAAAQTHAGTALTQANIATDQVALATTQKSLAITQATNAATSAALALTRAETATTQATAATAAAVGASNIVLGVSTLYPNIRPTLDLDFANSQTVDPRITFTRASTATRTNARGLIELVPSGVPRIDFDPVTGACKGLLIEEQRANNIRNNTMVGAVAGTPGALPTNWTYSISTTTGLTTSVVGAGADNGISYVDLKLAGTASGAGTLSVFFEDANTSAMLTAQNWTLSAYAKLQAGSLTGLTLPIFRIYEYTSGIGFVAAQLVSIGLPTSAELSTQRFTGTMTTTGGGTTAFGRPLFAMTIANGAAIDVTLRIGMPQLEQGAYATSVIPTVASQVTRVADVASMTGANFSSWWNSASGTLVTTSNVRSGSNVVTAGTAAIASTASVATKYALAYSSSNPASTLVVGTGLHEQIVYYPRSLTTAEQTALKA